MIKISYVFTVATVLTLPALTACSDGLTIKTVPEGASLRLNGDYVGQSPVTVDYDKHKPIRVIAEKNGYFPVEETFHPHMTAAGAVLWGPRNDKSRKLESPITIHLKPAKTQAPPLRDLPKNW